MTVIAQRMQEAMKERGLRQIDLVRATGIGRASISTYLTGEYAPKQKNIYLISKALNVNEAWLLGFSDDMQRKEVEELDKAIQSIYPGFEPGEMIENHLIRIIDSEVLKLYCQLNSDGKQYIKEQLLFALSQERYKNAD